MYESELVDEYGRVPHHRLRHWSTYATAGEYWADYRGYVPIQQMVVISQVMRARGCTFVEAYRVLLDTGAIIHIEEVPLHRPPERS